MNPVQVAVVLSVALFVGMTICLEIGYRLGSRSSKKHPESAHEGVGVIEAAVFALLGLLLGFSFSGGMSRLDARRQLIVREANTIGTAYLRLDLLPVNDQPGLRHLFRDYLDTRLRVYEALPDMPAADRELARGAQQQQQIWSTAVVAGGSDPSQNVFRMLLPALNEMIDVTTARTVAIHTSQPRLIFFLLASVALVSSLLAGYAMEKRKQRSLLHMVIYAAAIAVTFYSILDLENPRSGLIRLDTADRALHQLRDSIR